MKASVNEDCIGCGLCEGTCPDVFTIGDDGIAQAVEGDMPEDAEDSAQEAADNCPVSAITIE
ncbi:MAG: ferredoxin [Coriobacteriaceae bacterium]|uniref:ferredoxin n=1 Tax=Tractidigestivibacter sp. TaxID=2847320 RepID=UPI002A80BD4B|nr:ferredoxin [Tractidigestivibacter sp.]MCI6273375.1 ferredoxin [Coriobacteriaceae bacterium]MCI6548832.1 ferredoxin [Coriobacteriaceae bacterium]MCI6845231.1 ferredoxin [Coriobacteriaceae bacterium]MCI7438645.1 ferredoxin [Coriobacteriaceae bacterium]MDD7584658.1 ferredoxin [Coriobacteriaceae bacterium]